ncbi:hypothetical protein TWF173_007127 [Orbilia oligospora]|nr:hypothetical protein TWF173_007127 [Orbilia oligospora]
MSDPSEDLSSMGFTSFGKTPKHHQTAPIHANPTPFPTSSTSTSLPPRPPFQQGNQPPHNQHHNNNNNNQNYRGRGGRNFNNRGGRGGGGGGGGQGHQGHQGQGGPHRRNFHTNPQFQRGGRGGRHHHPYPNRQSHDNHQQRQDFTTSSSTPSYRSKEFGEGLYKPSMNEDPWAPLTQNRQSQSQSQPQSHQQSKTPITTTTTTPNDVWMGQTAAATSTNIEDKSTWYDKPEDKAADGGGWNADEIDLGDD